MFLFHSFFLSTIRQHRRFIRGRCKVAFAVAISEKLRGSTDFRRLEAEGKCTRRKLTTTVARTRYYARSRKTIRMLIIEQRTRDRRSPLAIVIRNRGLRLCAVCGNLLSKTPVLRGFGSVAFKSLSCNSTQGFKMVVEIKAVEGGTRRKYCRENTNLIDCYFDY